MAIITVSDGASEYRVTSAAYDAAMARYLPDSPLGLRAFCEARSGLDLSHVRDVSVFVAMLADWDFNTDSSPFSIDANNF